MEQFDQFPRWRARIALFLSGQFVSLFGSALVQFAIIWHITLSTGSGLMLTISTLCGFLPQIVISFFSGVWADRYSRKRLIILGDSLTAVCTLILALLFFAGYDHIWLLFAASSIRAIGGGIQQPAINALLPQMVPQEKLSRVNGVNSTLQSANMLIAPAVSGVLIKTMPLEGIFFIDVVTATAAVLIVALITVPALTERRPSGGYFTDFIEGFRYIRRTHVIAMMLLFYGLFMFSVAPAALITPLQVTRNYGEDVFYLTAIEIAFSIGSLVGGIAMALWGGFKNRLYSVASAYLLFGGVTVLLGIPVSFPVYFVYMAFAGITIPLFSTPFTVFLQETVDPGVLGRVFAFVQILGTSAMPLGMVVFGPMADRMPIEYLLLGTGAFILIQSTVFLHFARKPRETSAN